MHSTEHPDDRTLARLVSERRVGFKVWTDSAVVGGELVQTGLRVELLAPSRHEDGCRYSNWLACPAVFADLATIARAVLPTAIRDSGYFLDGFDRCLHIDPKRHFEEDVLLAIHVRHRGSLQEPVDECQRRCTREITAALSRLGAERR